MFGCKLRNPLKIHSRKTIVPGFKHTVTVTLMDDTKHTLTHTDHLRDQKRSISTNPYSYCSKHKHEYKPAEVVDKIFVDLYISHPHSGDMHSRGSSIWSIRSDVQSLFFPQNIVKSVEHTKESIGDLETVFHANYNLI